jgi:hypothetical protein
MVDHQVHATGRRAEPMLLLYVHTLLFLFAVTHATTWVTLCYFERR